MAPDALRSLSAVWFALTLQTPVLVGVVLLVGGRQPDLPGWMPALLVASVGVGASLAVHAMERLLAATPPPDEAAALTTVRVRSLVQWAVAEAPLLTGVVVALVLGPGWVVVVGALGSVEALLYTRPSAARFARLSRAWQQAEPPMRRTRKR